MCLYEACLPEGVNLKNDIPSFEIFGLKKQELHSQFAPVISSTHVTKLGQRTI